ncbi:sugar-binding protein, partial [Streptomyces sp. SID5785]|uniref:ThuA domain-containing protein n=1 Tax=Streptomyces sp. SID5785 TaxID=2690309 RepID=UPI0013615F7F
MSTSSTAAPPLRHRGRHRFRLTLFAALLALIGASLGLGGTQARAADAGFRVLVFSKVTNFAHDSIPAGIEAVRKLGAENGFEVEATDDAGAFTDENLSRFQAIVFNNTNSTPEKGDLLDADQRAALQKYVRGGGGWVGLHAASASERDWDWYEG